VHEALWKSASIAGIVATFALRSQRTPRRRTSPLKARPAVSSPTAYVVESAKGHVFSIPAIGYHFINANKVIGDVHTFSIAEGFANRAELGYTRSVHWTGDSPAFSSLWHFAGMNIFNGKVVAIKDGEFRQWMPGVAAGFVVRTDDKFVSGALYQELAACRAQPFRPSPIQRRFLRLCNQDLAASAASIPH